LDLVEAVKLGDIAPVKEMLTQGADPNDGGPEGIPPLIWAAAAGNNPRVSLLLSSGAESAATGPLGENAFMEAATHGRFETLKLLMESGRPPEGRDEEGMNPLIAAAARGRKDAVSYLLEKGGDVYKAENGLERSLITASRYGQVPVVELLLEKGANVDYRGEEDSTALMIASYKGINAVVKVLLAKGANPNLKDKWGCAPLALTARTGSIEAAKMLLEAGAAVNERGCEGKTPLAIAASRGNVDFVKLLLDNGADPDGADDHGRTASDEAGDGGYWEVVRLLGKRPKTEEKGKPGSTTAAPRSSWSPDVVVIEPPVKVAQLTGEFDRERKTFTRNRTLSRYKLAATDLGASFRHKGRLYMLFGDTVGANGGDAIAYTDDKTPDDGLDLTFVEEKPGVYRPIKIPGISQKDFEVPVAGVSVGGKMYLYFTTDHHKGEYMGRCVLAVSEDDGVTFRRLYDVSSHYFINVSVVEAGGVARAPLPGFKETTIVMFGADRLRKGDVRLAVRKASEIESRSGARFFSGVDAHGRPQWSDYEKDSVPLFGDGGVGELSVTYNTFLRKWIALYTYGKEPHAVHFRTADVPWGPWSASQPVFELSKSGGLCRFIHRTWDEKKCDTLHEPGWEKVQGGCYGPYQFGDFATGDASRTTIYFTLSTWNPYQVVLMKVKLGKKRPDGPSARLSRGCATRENP
jgi:ankyrin repeat protein